MSLMELKLVWEYLSVFTMEAFILGFQFFGLSISHEQVIDHVVVRHDECPGLRVVSLGKLMLVHYLTSKSGFAPFTLGMDPVMELRMILIRLTPVLFAAMLEEVVLDGAEDSHAL